MAKLALLLSLLAACLSGYAAWSSCEAGKDLRAQIDANGVLAGRIADLEAAAARRGPVALPLLAAAPEGTAGPAAAPSAALAGRPAAPATVADLERRLADLEKKEKEYAELVAKWKGAGADGVVPAPQVATELMGANMPAIYNTVEDAEKHLGLSPSQKAEFERATEESKRDIEQLKKVPDDEGKTWAEVEKDVVKIDGGSISFDGTKLQAFREKLVPGRNESFGAAERRIADGAKKRMRDALTPDQQGKFDKAVMPGLVGNGGGFGGIGDIMFSTGFTTDDAPAMDGK